MSDSDRRMSDERSMRTEQLLRSMSAQLEWPSTPDLATRIEPRLNADRSLHAPLGATSDHSASGSRARRSVVVAFAVLLLAASAAAAIPGVRDPVLDWLGLRSVKVERIPRAFPQPNTDRLGLGKRISLAGARRRLEFTPLVAPELGTPVVYYDAFPPGGQVVLAYGGGQLLLSQVQGSIPHQYLDKFLLPGTKAERFRIDGERALWISGALHQYAYADRTGEVRTDSVRTAGNVLLWRRGDLVLRLEGAATKAGALRIAHSLRAAP